jgi:hypothetical protein
MSTEFPTDDAEFEDHVLTKVEASGDGWHILHDGIGFFCPNLSPIEPRPGMTARFYGHGLGSRVRGLFLDGRKVFYRTEAANRIDWRTSQHSGQGRMTWGRHIQSLSRCESGLQKTNVYSTQPHSASRANTTSILRIGFGKLSKLVGMRTSRTLNSTPMGETMVDFKFKVSRSMQQCIESMRTHGNTIERFPGGFWRCEAGGGYSFGTSTVEALIKRGIAEYVQWQPGRNGPFPIKAALKPTVANSVGGEHG